MLTRGESSNPFDEDEDEYDDDSNSNSSDLLGRKDSGNNNSSSRRLRTVSLERRNSGSVGSNSSSVETSGGGGGGNGLSPASFRTRETMMNKVKTGIKRCTDCLCTLCQEPVTLHSMLKADMFSVIFSQLANSQGMAQETVKDVCCGMAEVVSVSFRFAGPMQLPLAEHAREEVRKGEGGGCCVSEKGSEMKTRNETAKERRRKPRDRKERIKENKEKERNRLAGRQKTRKERRKRISLSIHSI